MNTVDVSPVQMNLNSARPLVTREFFSNRILKQKVEELKQRLQMQKKKNKKQIWSHHKVRDGGEAALQQRPALRAEDSVLR